MPPDDPLPNFTYHHDPVATGSVIRSEAICAVCGEARGYVYRGPIYGVGDYGSRICPWCVADGGANEKLDVTFHDDAELPGWQFEEAPRVPPEVARIICERTLGFSGWQQEQWFTCCDDAAVFLGSAGRPELENLWPAAIVKVQESCGLDGEAWSAFFAALSTDQGPTAYVFQCRHCGQFGAYQDTD